MPYFIGEDAELDLDAIWEFIAKDSIDAADRWLEKLFDAFTAISDSPGVGHRRGDWIPLDVLFSAVGSYLIIYRVKNDTVQILAVTQGSRDVPSFVKHRFV